MGGPAPRGEVVIESGHRSRRARGNTPHKSVRLREPRRAPAGIVVVGMRRRRQRIRIEGQGAAGVRGCGDRGEHGVDTARFRRERCGRRQRSIAELVDDGNGSGPRASSDVGEEQRGWRRGRRENGRARYREAQQRPHVRVGRVPWSEAERAWYSGQRRGVVAEEHSGEISRRAACERDYPGLWQKVRATDGQDGQDVGLLQSAGDDEADIVDRVPARRELHLGRVRRIEGESGFGSRGRHAPCK